MARARKTQKIRIKTTRLGKKPTAVIALGGNALIKPGQVGHFREQMANITEAARHIVPLVKKGWKIAITHGNGPQVGNILIQQEGNGMQKMPLHVCVAETQAQIGTMIKEAFRSLDPKCPPVAVLMTQVLVDLKDPAFQNPTKPIGPFYKEERGLPIEWHIVKTYKGWRRVVASPEPKEIVEASLIKQVAGDSIVVSCGGGGIPAFRGKKGTVGVDAVIDKDLTAQLLAGVLKADYLIMLTDVDRVCLDYKMKSQKKVSRMTLKEAKLYMKQGHFHPGSMRPKMTAAIRFLEDRKQGKVIITRLGMLDRALKGKGGTEITRD